jgi:hypothetical protein
MMSVAARARTGLAPESGTEAPARPAGTDRDATRYLCAAAHLDTGYTRRLVRELLVSEQRLPHPVPGVDLPTVLRHALAARSRRLYRDCALVGITVLAIAVCGWAALAWYVWLIGCWFAVRAARSGAARSAASFAAVLWTAMAVVLLALLVTDSDPFGLRGAWHPAPARPADALRWVAGPAAATAACWLVVFVEQVAAYLTVTERLRRDRFTPGRWLSAEPAWAQHALAVLGGRLADGRLVRRPVADPATPFVGSGHAAVRRRWLIDLGPAATNSAPFDCADLLDRIGERLAGGIGPLDPSALVGAPAEIVVDECAVSTAPALVTRGGPDGAVRLLPDAPQGLHPGPGGGPARTYRRIRIGTDPAGLTVTAYLNATAGAGLLQVELYGYILGPIAARYRVADRAVPFGWDAATGCAARAGAQLAHRVFTAPREVCRTAAEPAARRRRRAALARKAGAGLTVEAGARFCAREAAAAPAGADRFADEDANLYLAVVERRVRDELRPLLPPVSVEF